MRLARVPACEVGAVMGRRIEDGGPPWLVWRDSLCNTSNLPGVLPTPEAWARHYTALEAQCLTGPTLQSGKT